MRCAICSRKARCGTLGDPVSMLYGPMDPNERFRARRDRTRRTKRRRRAAVLALLLVVVIAVAMGARFVGDRPSTSADAGESRSATPSLAAPVPAGSPRPLPVEIRGVHVTGALASLPGKFREYIGYKSYGLNTIELDVKDESGEIGFTPADVPLARTVGATRPYYNPKALVGLAHRNGIYMIGRVVCFQDPMLASAQAGSRDPAAGRERLDDSGRPRLGQPVRPSRLGLLRLGRRGGSEGRVRPDHVRLRAIPVRRRRRRRRLSGQDERLEGPRDRRLRRVREASGSSRTARRSRPRSSGSPRRVTSESDRCRGGSRRTSTRCRRCRTRCSTATVSSGSRAPAPSPARRSSGR